MTPFDLNQACVVPSEEGDIDLADHASSFSCSDLFSSCHDQGADYCTGRHVQQPLQEPADADDDDALKLSLCDPDNITEEEGNEEEEEADRPGTWMSSKMRFMRKMMNSTHIVVSKPRGSMLLSEDQSQRSQGNGNGIIRICSDCNTTKTPLWRSGPRGPKSLCNACGIRQRKARRAMAAAAALNGGLIPATAPAKVRKEKKLDIDRTLPFKKRCKVDASSATAKKLCFDDVQLSSNKNTAIQKVFPQEERDAAILLMALSCGLIRS
ncbi:hypothetical protein MUK42_28051 [Musa troglodytarum]|uniref:GATA-type domain-containing protein n=1 Tax=Musa troglodytarum TaxID=320322 RepID=A0A9E7F8X2_9LILI|nr:hypothetical protein MUK42_28051 [Musa troglodytarum]